jgi:hypothetical protein
MTKFMMDITSSQQEEFTRLALCWLRQRVEHESQKGQGVLRVGGGVIAT